MEKMDVNASILGDMLRFNHILELWPAPIDIGVCWKMWYTSKQPLNIIKIGDMMINNQT